jgi:hypothetical protein
MKLNLQNLQNWYTLHSSRKLLKTSIKRFYYLQKVDQMYIMLETLLSNIKQEDSSESNILETKKIQRPSNLDPTRRSLTDRSGIKYAMTKLPRNTQQHTTLLDFQKRLLYCVQSETNGC